MIIISFGFEESIPVIQKAIKNTSHSNTPPLFFTATRNGRAKLDVQNFGASNQGI
jgi:hypothetical protein